MSYLIKDKNVGKMQKSYQHELEKNDESTG